MHNHSFLLHIIAFSAGAVGGYFVGKYVTKCKYEELFATELKHIEDYYVGAHPEKPRRGQENATPVAGNVEMHPLNGHYEKPPHVPYASKYEEGAANNAVDEDTDYEDNDIVLEMESAETDAAYKQLRDKPIEVIDEEEYGEIELYSKFELYYYKDNDTLTLQEGSDEEMIYFNEVEDLIGDTLASTHFKYDDNQVLYVRNNARMADYRIEKIFHAFG